MSKKKLVQPKGIKLTKEFIFKLTDTELKERGQVAAKARAGAAAFELQFEEVKETWKAKIKVQENLRDAALDVIHAGDEKRSVEATMVKNFNSGEVEYWYEGAILERRVMTEPEKQMEITDLQKTGKKARAVRQKLQKIDPTSPQANGLTQEQIETGQVIKEETSRRTKLSSVDGPVQ